MSASRPKICIVGSGPAALYTAQYINRHFDESNGRPIVDIYEKLPVPFGLVRYGVAPDHQDVKNVINSFMETIKKENVNFYGNVSIGNDLKVNELLSSYDSVVLAYGSHSENYLNIPGEKTFGNLISARDFVSWYNGLPQSENIRLNLKGKRAVIIGAGNVAIDIARLLLSPVEKLAQTDISAKSLEVFRNENNIEHVSIVARRGILNAAFTLKELRELTKIDSTSCRIDLEQLSQINVTKILNKLSRPRKRIVEYMYNIATKSQSVESDNKKRIEFVFMRTPTEIVGASSGDKNVTGVKFKVSRYNEDFNRNDIKLDTEEALNSLSIIDDPSKAIETLPADLVIRSIGFKNVNIDEDIPFDKKHGVVSNQCGKVIGKQGLYCTGWIKRGPRGVIVDTTTDAYETAKKLCNDLTTSQPANSSKKGSEQILELLKSRNIQVVDKLGWMRIDQEEVRRGKENGKPREKFQNIQEMLKVALAK